MGSRSSSILWFRRDLRLNDNPALKAAMARGCCVVPVFIWDPGSEGAWVPGAASMWWLHQSLKALDADLRTRESRLIIRHGKTVEALAALVKETGAAQVFANRCYEPRLLHGELGVARAIGVEIVSFDGLLLKDPWQTLNRQGNPYRVFTPFWRAQFDEFEPEPSWPAPACIPGPSVWPDGVSLSGLNLEPRIDWAASIRSAWQPGEHGSKKMLDRFSNAALTSYPVERDRPDHVGTSRLSPHLHFGEISPAAVWRAIRRRAAFGKGSGLVKAEEAFLRQLVWREFAHNLLVHFPGTPDEPLRPEFSKFRWREDHTALKAWQRGRTGYPFVDAGVRELWATGWMHNRVRMVAASFLVKHLLIPWRTGAKWFWDTLVDADLANNTFGWQWTAGCGADAAPYFRVFNPVLQGEKFDPNGDYVRQWVPEVAKLPDKWIHRPWQASPTLLAELGITIGKDYPSPIVDHEFARKRTLEAYEETRSHAKTT